MFKDEFIFSHMELLIDATTSYEALSLIDGYSGYKPDNMHPEDEDMTAFPFAKVFFYQVFPLGLKNVEATYQQVMTVIFKEILGDMVECYVYELVVKSYQRIDHLKHLEIVLR